MYCMYHTINSLYTTYVYSLSFWRVAGAVIRFRGVCWVVYAKPYLLDAMLHQGLHMIQYFPMHEAAYASGYYLWV